MRNCIELIQRLSRLRRQNCLETNFDSVGGLLMEVFHGGCAKNDKEPHPQGSTLEGNGLIGVFPLSVVFGSKDDGVKKQREETQHEKQLDHEDHEILGVMLNARTSL